MVLPCNSSRERYICTKAPQQDFCMNLLGEIGGSKIMGAIWQLCTIWSCMRLHIDSFSNRDLLWQKMSLIHVYIYTDNTWSRFWSSMKPRLYKKFATFQHFCTTSLLGGTWVGLVGGVCPPTGQHFTIIESGINYSRDLCQLIAYIDFCVWSTDTERCVKFIKRPVSQLHSMVEKRHWSINFNQGQGEEVDDEEEGVCFNTFAASSSSTLSI